MGTYEKLSNINVNEHVEPKNGFNYLTWSWAWDELKKNYPDATYTIWKNEQGLPYAYDPLTGFMVYTSVTIEGLTHEMWLPVMDGANNAMKAEAYSYTTKSYGKEVVKTVKPATMFDINKTIMRCLVKNLAMFGLGLYIYAGEDLPTSEEEAPRNGTQDEKKPINEQERAIEEAKKKARVIKYVNDSKMTEEQIAQIYRVFHIKSLNELTLEHCNYYISQVEEHGGKI